MNENDNRDVNAVSEKNSEGANASQPENNNSVTIRNQVSVPLQGGKILSEIFSFRGLSDGEQHIAIALGPWQTAEIPLVRVHSECLTGDVFGSAKCDCGPQLNESLNRVSVEGGFVLYLRQEGRGIGLYSKLDSYSLQEKGHDTYTANRMLDFPDDGRNYQCAAEMLRALGRTKIRLLSNNPDKQHQLEKHGILVTEMVSTGVFMSTYNRSYLSAKVRLTKHRIKL